MIVNRHDAIGWLLTADVFLVLMALFIVLCGILKHSS
jgi:hypothetical protein